MRMTYKSIQNLHLNITRKHSLFDLPTARYRCQKSIDWCFWFISACCKILLNTNKECTTSLSFVNFIVFLKLSAMVSWNCFLSEVNVDFTHCPGSSDSKRLFMVHCLVLLNFWFTGEHRGQVLVKIKHQSFSEWTWVSQWDCEAPLLLIICSSASQFRWCGWRIMTNSGCLLNSWFTVLLKGLEKQGQKHFAFILERICFCQLSSGELPLPSPVWLPPEPWRRCEVFPLFTANQLS